MIVHIAGKEIYVGSQLRQRCGWCGAVLIDDDVCRTMVLVDAEHTRPGPIPTWPKGELVAVQGGASWVVEHEDGADLPLEACAMIDHEVTA